MEVTSLMNEHVFKVGDRVRYWFDTGAFGCQFVHGTVEKAGARTYTVRWESGIRNRLRQGWKDVLRLTPELEDS